MAPTAMVGVKPFRSELKLCTVTVDQRDVDREDQSNSPDLKDLPRASDVFGG